ncbi:MFS transporter [Phenylobacterium sp.]|uniref:MFS transporter n=1 Tax=Phenylobacterium sp. TaxID=1871053 RepID=UPI0025D08BEA|nr:MFS transporter [Phenylobacterium sp.]
MSFFKNAAINRVNLHTGVQAFAMGAGGIFFLVFLLRAGVSVPMVLGFQAALVAQRFLLRPGVLPLAKRIGLRRTLILGTVLEAAVYPILAEVRGIDAAFWAMCLVAPIGSVLYWTCYHAYFASLGDAEHRGGQIGAREALSAMVGIVAPLAGTWALVTAGPRIAFAGVAVIQLLAAVPLLGAPDVAVAREAPGGFRAARLGATLMATDGWLAACYYYVWQVALFMTLGESLSAYGGAMALSALVGAVGGMVLGRRIDAGHGRVAMLVAYAVVAGVVVLRAFSLGSPWLAVAANAFGTLVAALQAPAMMTPVYNLAQASPCPLRFHIATEGGWDLGCFGGCLAAAAIAALGHGLGPAILLGFVGVVPTVVLLWRRYGVIAALTAA